MGMFALATMLLATSCSEDEIVAQSSGNEVTVSFTAQLRSDVKTKAVGDDTDNVDKLVFAVYDEEGDELSDLRQELGANDLTSDGNKKKATINVVLVKGQTYSFAFWAQDKDYTAYKFDPATAEVAVNYGQTANNKSADAFFANVTNYTVNGSFEMDVTLKRPFAQVNFLVTEAELKAAKAAGFEPAQSSVTVQNAATSLNVLTGEVEGNTEATFNLANLISDETTTIKNAEGNYITWDKDNNRFSSSANASYACNFNYLATAYFLPTSATGVTTISAATQVKASSTSKSPVDVAVAEASAQRNYRTNIYGSLLTSQGKIYVTIDPAFDGEYGSEYEDPTTQVVGTIEEANQLFAAETPATNVTITVAPITASDIILPKTTEDVTINFSYEANTNPAEVTIKYAQDATDSEKPVNITVNGDGGDLVINTPNSTATVNGNYNSVTATTAPNTLIVPKGVTIGALTIKGGNAEIYYGAVTGTVTNEGKGTITWLVDSKAQLFNIATAVNEATFVNGNIELTGDIDLNNEAWTPIGLNADESKKFKGVFDGQGHIISNLKVNTEAGYTAAGFFGALDGTAKNFTIDGASINHISTGAASDNGIAVVAGSIYTSGSIEGVTVKNATVTGNRYLGGISGYTYGSVTNCTVENITLTATPDNQSGSYDNGDKVGGIAGYFASESTYQVANNSVSNVTIKGYRDLGGIVGCANGANFVTNNTVAGTNSITVDQVTNPYGDKAANAASVVGRITAGTLDNSNTVSGTVAITINKEEVSLADLSTAVASGGDVTLTEDVKGEAITTAPYGNKTGLIQNGGVIDGGGNTLSVECSGDDYGIMTTGGTIKNLIINDGSRAIVLYAPTEDVILDNVQIGGDGILYPLNTAEHPTVEGIDLVASNSTFKGWTSFAGIESASFTNCTFGVGTYGNLGWPYGSLLKPYINTTLKNCTFADKYYLDLSALGANCTVTLENCTVNGTTITENIVGTECNGTETFCVELSEGRTLADCVIFK